MTSEASIVAAIRKYLKSIGAKTHKTHGSTLGHAGTPDILGVYTRCDGKVQMLALEVKKPGGRLTKLQDHELAEWAKAGAIAGRVESVEEVKKLIGEPNA